MPRINLSDSVNLIYHNTGHYTSHAPMYDGRPTSYNQAFYERSLTGINTATAGSRDAFIAFNEAYDRAFSGKIPETVWGDEEFSDSPELDGFLDSFKRS